MTRPASVAVGGYFPTPDSLIPLIANLIDATTLRGSYALLDPCAGDGAALHALAAGLFGEHVSRHRLYAIELEQQRARAIRGAKAFHADAFQIAWETNSAQTGADVLFLNPPYDRDPVHGRLEQAFLARYTDALVAGGLLLFLVPFHALAASARFLAQHYDAVRCWRFPEPHWSPFKQVVLIGVKRQQADLFVTSDTPLVQTIMGWATDAASIPVLPDTVAEPSYALLPRGAGGFAHIAPLALDVRSALAAAPTGAGLRVLALDQTPHDLTNQVFPVAQPPKPGHIAQVLAAGLLSGVQVTPDLPGLPPLLVNGSFERAFHTTDTRTDREGEVTGYVQVQQPKLRVSVLDLTTYAYYDLAPGTEPTGSMTLGDFTIADLLAHYHTSLVQVLHQQCPALHDPQQPDHQRPLPPTARRLYAVQEQAVQTALKLLDEGATPFVLGEVGTGKSTVALHTAFAFGARRILVLCPPHLTVSWQEQVQAVLPGATPVIVERLADVDAPPDPARTGIGHGIVVLILSQTAAKLGSTLAVGTEHDRCPACGAAHPDADAIVKQRRWCHATRRIPADDLAHLCVDLAHLLLPCAPTHSAAQQLVQGRYLRRMRKDWATWAPGRLDALVLRLVPLATSDTLREALPLLCLAVPGERDDLLVQVADALYTASTSAPDGSALRRTARTLLLLLHDADRALAAGERLRDLGLDTPRHTWESDPWPVWRTYRQGTQESALVRWRDGLCSYRVGGQWYAQGGGAAAAEALTRLAAAATWRRSAPCNTPLYQVTPTPRRYPIATYLRRYRPDAYDFLLLDEGHEYRTDGTAQERAAHRLAEGKPTLLLSGSISSGKSSSLFANMWACSQPFRREFARDQRAAFVTRYGYRKRLVEVASRDHEVVQYGAQTDRVDVNDLGETRALGEAPGVLPLFLVKHVLPIGVWMHKDDLDADLPPYTEVRAPVEPLPEQAQRYADVQQTVLHRITQDRFTRDYAGKLFGHLGELPSYLDRCTADTGNVPGAATWQVCYPAQIGGGLVAQAALFSATTLLPKETWLCETVQAELAEHRPVLIFVWHTQTGLHRRVQRVLTEAGIASTYLDANRVSTKKRQAWIEQQVAQGCTVLLVNPLAVQTGLNSLTHFCTGIWYEPICDAIVWRQANGRLHRIGQQQPVRIYAPEYTSTAQTVVLDLNALKVRAALALDGLDTSAALQASGAGDHTDDAYDLGRALYQRLTMQPQGAAPPARLPPETRTLRQLRLPFP